MKRLPDTLIQDSEHPARRIVTAVEPDDGSHALVAKERTAGGDVDLYKIVNDDDDTRRNA